MVKVNKVSGRLDSATFYQRFLKSKCVIVVIGHGQWNRRCDQNGQDACFYAKSIEVLVHMSRTRSVQCKKGIYPIGE